MRIAAKGQLLSESLRGRHLEHYEGRTSEVDRKSAIGTNASILNERFQANALFDPQGSRTRLDLIVGD
jgi:hypothetical protein